MKENYFDYLWICLNFWLFSSDWTSWQKTDCYTWWMGCWQWRKGKTYSWNTVKVLIFTASNFCGFSQLDKFAGTFFRVFLIAQKQKKMYFSVNQFISRWQDKIVLHITFVMWNLLTLFYLNGFIQRQARRQWY